MAQKEALAGSSAPARAAPNAADVAARPAMRGREWLSSFLLEKMRPVPGAGYEMASALDAIESASGKDAKAMDALSRVTERVSAFGPIAVRMVISNMSAISARVQGPAILLSALGVASHILGEGAACKGSPEEICKAILCAFQGLEKIGEKVFEPDVFEDICDTAHSLEGHFLVSKYVSYMGDAAAHIGGAVLSPQVLSRQAKAIAVQASIDQLRAEAMVSLLAAKLKERTAGPA